MTMPIKSAAITASASGATAVVAAVSGKSIAVLGYVLTANGAVNVKFQSASTDKTGLLYFLGTAPAPVSAPVIPQGNAAWFSTAPGEALNINLSGSVAVGGHVLYQEL